MTDNDFDNFYENKLLPVMDKLRAECRRADNWGITALLSFAAAVIILYLGVMQHMIANYGMYCLILFVLAAVSLFLYTRRNDVFTDDYKKYVIREIINHLTPGIEYHADEYISEEDYQRSSLYRYIYDYYSGSDFMSGSLDNIPFQFSEICTQYDDGNQQPIIFKGLFFIIQTNFTFSGSTYGWATEAVQLASSIYDEGYRLMPMTDVDDVGFGDADFENYYRVYSTYPGEAATILSTLIRKKFTDLRKFAGCPVSFSFVNGNLYIAIQNGAYLLEPPDTDPGNKEAVRQIFFNLQAITGVIKILQPDQLNDQ